MAAHDLVVIGGGPAGYAAALYGASGGLDVGLVEKDKLGGTCLHQGCIPAKELLEAASIFTAVKNSQEFGIQAGDPTLDMKRVQSRKQEVIDTLFKGLSGTVKSRGVTVYEGTGTLQAGKKVHITPSSGKDSDQLDLEAQNIILAAGSQPRGITDLEIDGKKVVTSDHLLSWEQVPETAAIIGAGAIGAEFASLLSDLGTKVLLLEALDTILSGVDGDVSRVVHKSFESRGIEIATGVGVKGFDAKSGTLAYGDQKAKVDAVVVCVGRRPFADALGLDRTGVRVLENGFVAVNEFCETEEPGVFAIGDLIATPQLAHVGFAEAILSIQQILGEDPSPINYDRVPWGIYCRPEVAFAGLTEAAAKEAGYEVDVNKHRFAANSRAQILGETEGLVKVVADKATGQILGVHMAGPWVTEQLGAGYLAVNWEATVQEVAEFVAPHPTLGELFSETVLALTGRPLHG